jgi:UDP-glucose:(heptosyl)LPS alpha-1,3-glucosyltransferase
MHRKVPEEFNAICQSRQEMSLQITIANDRFDPRGGGSERYLADIARWLLRNGHRVSLFARQASSELPDSLLTIATPVMGGWLGEYSFSRKLSRHVREAKGPVLSAKAVRAATHYVLTSGVYRRAFEAECEACEPGMRKRLFPLGNRINRKRQWLIRRQEALLSAKPGPQLLVFSSALKTDLLRNFGTPADAILVARPGVNLRRFRPVVCGRGPMAPDFLFVAHNFELKGLRTALLALEQAHRRGVKAGLQVVGRGDQAPFESLAEELGVARFVRFHSWVDDEVLTRLLGQCSALVHPTFYDPCSLVVLEALASGCPVITTRCNGASEIMVSGRHGFVLADPRDVEQLSTALLALSHEHTVNEMRQNTLELRTGLDFENHALTLVRWLTGALANEGD